MISERSLNKEDLWLTQINFWLVWTVANTIAVALGLIAGENIGRTIFNEYGHKIGIFIGGIIFEGIVLVARSMVFGYYEGLKTLQAMDAFAWIMGGVTGMIFEAANASGVYEFTLVPLFSIGISAFITVVFRIVKGFRLATYRKKKFGILKILIIIVASEMVAGLFVILIFVLSGYYGRAFEGWNPDAALFVTGLTLGALLGCATGIVHASEIPMAIEVGKTVEKIMQIRRQKRLAAMQRPFWLRTASFQRDVSKNQVQVRSTPQAASHLNDRKRTVRPVEQRQDRVRAQIIQKIKRRYKL